MDYSSILLMTFSTLLTISSNYLTISSTLLIIIVGSCQLIRGLVPIDTSPRAY